MKIFQIDILQIIVRPAKAQEKCNTVCSSNTLGTSGIGFARGADSLIEMPPMIEMMTTKPIVSSVSLSYSTFTYNGNS